MGFYYTTTSTSLPVDEDMLKWVYKYGTPGNAQAAYLYIGHCLLWHVRLAAIATAIVVAWCEYIIMSTSIGPSGPTQIIKSYITGDYTKVAVDNESITTALFHVIICWLLLAAIIVLLRNVVFRDLPEMRDIDTIIDVNESFDCYRIWREGLTVFYEKHNGQKGVLPLSENKALIDFVLSFLDENVALRLAVNEYFFNRDEEVLCDRVRIAHDEYKRSMRLL